MSKGHTPMINSTIPDMDREWAEALAGRPCTDQEVLQAKADYEDWVDSSEQAMDEDPRFYTGN